MDSRPELLAPVQDWNSLKVVNGLADAIYFGVGQINMRSQSAANFNIDDLKKIAKICNNNNIKSYFVN